MNLVEWIGFGSGKVRTFHFIFLKYILLITLLQFSQFSPSIPLPPYTPNPPASPPQFMSMGCTYKFFGFSVTYTVLNLSPSTLCQPIMLLIPCPFLPIPPLPVPTENPPCDLHFSSYVLCSSCLLSFCFLGSVVDSYEFAVILLFIVFDLLFLR